MFESTKKVLILSPHTDDAELGCGGTISKLIEDGHSILWVCFSTAEESLPKGFPPDSLKKEFLNVTSFLGLNENSIEFLTTKLENLPKADRMSSKISFKLKTNIPQK